MTETPPTHGAADFGNAETPLDVHVVAHTHWDREWYRSAGEFRQRLVALVDALIANASGNSFPFLLDGQAVVLEDYLAVRPEMADELARRLQAGDLEAGPWYVLADGLIPSGEALVRNLLMGRRILRRFGAKSPAVAYCPDTFGHSAAIPVIARGFGFPLAIVWRGFGSERWPGGDMANWLGADGEPLLLYHLPPDGYETGSALPAMREQAAKRWTSFNAAMQARSKTGVVLLPNGADHHALQPDIREAIGAMQQAAPSHSVKRSSLADFAAKFVVTAATRSDVPTIQGELRDSYGYTWTLGGTLGTRAHQKRANAKAERLLLRDVEPWLVLAWLHGNDQAKSVSADGNISLAQMPALLDAAWRELLRAHPHDTLCGCSIDTVARAMDVRVESTVAQAKALRAAALQIALRHDVVKARRGPLASAPQLVVRNRAARWRGGVAEVRIDETIGDVPVGPSSAAASDAQPIKPAGTPRVGNAPLQVLNTREVYRRRESPQHYPDNDRVREYRALVWLPPVPPVGLAVHPISLVGVSTKLSTGSESQKNGTMVTEDAGDRRISTGSESQKDATTHNETMPHPATVSVTGDSIELANGHMRVVASTAGIQLVVGERTLPNAITFETAQDVGDSYTPAIRGAPETLRIVAVKAGASGPIRASVIVELRTNRKQNGVRIRATIILDADSHVLRIDIKGENQRRNHRLRVNFNSDVRTTTDVVGVWADAAFGPVERRELSVPPEDQTREMMPPTMPMHRWATITNAEIGVTLHADGLAELEANRTSGALSLTLLRAIGELSRNDLAERPGHAGWPASIPLAQSQGLFNARVALQLHANWSQETRDAIEDASDSFLLPLTGETIRDLADFNTTLFGPQLKGTALRVSTITLADDEDGIVLRCVNDSEQTQSGQWTFPANSELEFANARMDETVLGAWQRSRNVYAFTAPPRAVVTIRARRPAP